MDLPKMQPARSEHINPHLAVWWRRRPYAFPRADRLRYNCREPEHFVDGSIQCMSRSFPNDRRAAVIVVSGMVIGIRSNQVKSVWQSNLDNGPKNFFRSFRRRIWTSGGA